VAVEQSVPVGEDAPLVEVMRTMRAMRRLEPDPVPDELLEKLVEAATWGPSGSNAQDYEFVVVTDRAQMARLAEIWRRCVDVYLHSIGRGLGPGMQEDERERLHKALRYQRDHFHETPALIVACYRTPRPDPAALRGMTGLGAADFARLLPRAPRFSVLGGASSVYPGVQNLLLRARALGLAANITIWHVFLEHEWRAALGIPRGVERYAVIPVGWPKGRFGPVRRRPAAEAIHRDRW
jgi:nitroreductase